MMMTRMIRFRFTRRMIRRAFHLTRLLRFLRRTTRFLLLALVMAAGVKVFRGTTPAHRRQV